MANGEVRWTAMSSCQQGQKLFQLHTSSHNPEKLTRMTEE
jgi:hypothetical protein